jgi:hypothetical protein
MSKYHNFARASWKHERKAEHTASDLVFVYEDAKPVGVAIIIVVNAETGASS